MSDVVEMVAWLRREIEADKAAAEAAKGSTSGVWEDDSDPASWIVLYDQSGKLTMGQHRHIARHDPRDVIADCDAKLTLLDAHREATAKAQFPDREGGIAEGLDEAVRLLAQGYRHRDGWREEWAE